MVMIKTRNDLYLYIREDNWYYDLHYSKWDKYLFVFLRDPQYMLRKYKKYLRKEEYHLNNKGRLHTLLYLYYLRKKNILGNKLGILIPPNTFGSGLTIMHHGEIIVNPNVRVGTRCILHGGNCIGNNGKEGAAPIIGDNADIGIGAKVIGGVKIGNNAVIGANAVVNKSFLEDGCIIVGVPAKKIK